MFGVAATVGLTLVLLAEASSATPDLVQEKIRLLGLRDDSIPFEEQPANWLVARMPDVTPELIAGLEARESRIAAGCLRILSRSSNTNAFLETVIRIAGKPRHPIYREAVLFLCGVELSPATKEALSKAVDDEKRFPDPEDRARIAAAIGDMAKAVKSVGTLLNQVEDDTDTTRRIAFLGQIGDASAVSVLSPLTTNHHWNVTVEAFLALAKIGLPEHRLTPDQEQFLRLSRVRMGKGPQNDWLLHWRKLASLDRKELRPHVLRSIASDTPLPGLIVLQEWKDRESLREIAACLRRGEERHLSGHFLCAYIGIDGTDASVTEAVSYLSRCGFDEKIQIVWNVVGSALPQEQKLAFLRMARDVDGCGTIVARSVRGRATDADELFSVMMREETNLHVLAEYAEGAATDRGRRFGPEVLAALQKVLATDGASDRFPEAVCSILDACAVYELPDAGRAAGAYLTATQATVRLSAARVVAACGEQRAQALSLIETELQNTNGNIRAQAVANLLRLPCRNEPERRERERAVLPFLGSPVEESVLRVLATCSGDETIARLTPFMDASDMRRAVHAAWILSQSSDPAVASNALRRLAIYSTFHRRFRQIDPVIQFEVAEGLRFSQTLGPSQKGDSSYTDRLRIPLVLFWPASLTETEQQFSVRAYRASCWAQGLTSPPLSARLDRSYVPLLRAIVIEDRALIGLHVKGVVVAHFPARKAAAAALCDVTGDKVSYKGLAGEDIDSSDVPSQPYRKQNVLVAMFTVDSLGILVNKCRQGPGSQDGVAWRGDELVRSMMEQFGADLRDEIRSECRRRGVVKSFRSIGFRFLE